MAFNTRHPVGSTDPRDLYDNATNFDKLMNGPDPFYADRLGKQRHSWSGMEEDFNNAQEGRASQFGASQQDFAARFAAFLQSSGYVDLGNYAAGLNITEYNQTFTRNGVVYRAAYETKLPYQTTGNWDLERTNFVSLGDASLRQDLANATDPALGAALVAFNGGTVADLATSSGASKIGYGRGTIADRLNEQVTVKSFGAIFDGTSHPLSERYSTLAAAKAVYPFVTALTQQIDWAALQAAHNYALTLKSGAEILFPAGKGYIGADTVNIPLGGYSGIHQRGCGQGITQLIHTGTLLFNVTYPEANWYLDYQGAQACSLHVSDMDITTTTADAATAYYINGGGFGGRASKASCFTNVSFHGTNNNLQGWLYSVDLVNGLQFWFTNCRFIQVPGSTVGTSFRARLATTTNNPAPGGGGYYFLHCEHFFGKCAWDIGPAIEGIYLTQCVTDGNILYGMIWESKNVGGLQVVGGQISTKVCAFYLDSVVHGCFTGCDIRASAQAGSGWVGFEFKKSNGFAFGGAINLLGNGSTGQIGMRFTDCALSAMLPMVVDGVSFVAMDYAGYLSGNNNNNIHFGPGNVYTGVSVPVYDPGLKAVVTRRTVQLTQSIAFTGGAATEKKVITLPPYMFTNPNKPVMVIANAQGVDLIGTYLPTDALTTSVAAAVSFRLTTGGNIPAGTYTITALVS